MSGYGGRRTQAERDAMTVEIGYALVSAVFAAALALGAVAGPAALFELPDPAEWLLPRAGLALAGLLFVVRAVSVLLRFPSGGRGGVQPSQPGRTSPDS